MLTDLGIVRITEALLEAEPDGQQRITRALDSGVGLQLRRLDQAWWPEVAVLWVSIGAGPAALIRYVAATDDGQLTVLTDRPAAFCTVAQSRAIRPISEAAICEYAAFYLEVTRPMDRSFELIATAIPADSPLAEAVRQVLIGPPDAQTVVFSRALRAGRITADGLSRLARAGRRLSDSGPAADTLRERGFSTDELTRLSRIRRLPTSALTPDESRLLLRARRCFLPGPTPHGVLSLKSADAPLQGHFVDERAVQIERDTDGLIRRTNAGAPWLASLPLAQLRGPAPEFIPMADGVPIAELQGGPYVVTAPVQPGPGAQLYRVGEFGTTYLEAEGCATGWGPIPDDAPTKPPPTDPFLLDWLGAGTAELPRAWRDEASAVAELALSSDDHVWALRLTIDLKGRVHDQRTRLV